MLQTMNVGRLEEAEEAVLRAELAIDIARLGGGHPLPPGQVEEELLILLADLTVEQAELDAVRAGLNMQVEVKCTHYQHTIKHNTRTCTHIWNTTLIKTHAHMHI